MTFLDEVSELKKNTSFKPEETADDVLDNLRNSYMTPGDNSERQSFNEPPRNTSPPPFTPTQMFVKKMLGELGYKTTQFSMPKVDNKVVPPKPLAKCDPSQKFCDFDCHCDGCEKRNCCFKYAKKRGGEDYAQEVANDRSIEDAIRNSTKKQQTIAPPVLPN